MPSKDIDSESKVGDPHRTQLGGPRRPDIKLGDFNERMTAMRSRLDALLPELARSNQELGPAQNMENLDSDDEDAQHIDMELACGVLEQKTPEADENEYRSLDGVRLPQPKGSQQHAENNGVTGLAKTKSPSSTQDDDLSTSDSDDMSSNDSSEASSDEAEPNAKQKAPYRPKT